MFLWKQTFSLEDIDYIYKAYCRVLDGGKTVSRTQFSTSHGMNVYFLKTVQIISLSIGFLKWWHTMYVVDRIICKVTFLF